VKDQKSEFSSLLHLTYVLQHLSDRNLLAATGVGLSQVRIMSVLSDTIAQPQNKIALDLQQTEANVSRQMQVMKKVSLVSVTKNKKDGRQRDVVLTAKGARQYKIALKALAAQQKGLLKLLEKKEVEAFERASGNLLSALNIKAQSRRELLGLR